MNVKTDYIKTFIDVTSNCINMIMPIIVNLNDNISSCKEKNNGIKIQSISSLEQEVISEISDIVNNFDCALIIAQTTKEEIQQLLDKTAVDNGFEDIKSARSYTGFDNYFKETALALATWSANCWVTAGGIQAQIESGDIEVEPENITDFVMSHLPVFGE